MAFAAGGSSKVLVVVNLSGGCSYNITPIYTGAYRDRNVGISYGPGDSIPLSNEQGLHPSFTGIQSLWNEGRLAVVNMVGYPNPNRSHDESTAIWHSGLRSSGSSSTMGGWGARLACQMNDSVFNGISLSGANTFIQGGCNPPRSVGDLQNFGERGFWGGEDGTKWLRDTRTELLGTAAIPDNDNARYLKDSMSSLDRSVETLQRETNITLPVTFPNTGFGRECENAAKLLAARSLMTRVVYLEHGGFDTHSGEKARLTSLLGELNGGLTALVNCAKALGRWEDLIIITMSEFGRTFVNASGGTDHGHASSMLVMGGTVAGGIKSPPPSDTEIQRANGFFSQYAVDFREPFKAAVQHMGYNPDSVFPEAISVRNLSLFG